MLKIFMLLHKLAIFGHLIKLILKIVKQKQAQFIH